MFKKENQFAKVGGNAKCLRAALREEVIRVAHSATRSASSLKGEMADCNQSRLQVYFNNALLKGNGAVIKEFLDRAIGRPSEAKPIGDDKALVVANLLKDDSRLSDMIARARKETKSTVQHEMVRVVKDSEVN